MSLEAALAEESNTILRRLDGRPSTVSRGRTSFDRSLSPHGQLRSTSRGRNRAISSDRRGRGTSRARSQGEDVNYKWSILFHDPSERFVKGKNGDDEDDSGIQDEDDLSEEEQISDDEQDFDYDINDLRLPNYRMSINEYYKGKSNPKGASAGAVSTTSNLINSLAKNLNLTSDEKSAKAEGEKLEKLSEVLALEKGLADAKTLGNNVPKETLEEVSKKLNDIGLNSQKLTVNDLVKLENAKDSKYEEYKKNLIDESKAAEVNAQAPQQEDSHAKSAEPKIKKSEVCVSEENMRVSSSVTLNKFFTKGLRLRSVNSYLFYIDLSQDNLMALLYVLGSVVKSGDVLYLINTTNDENKIEYYKRQNERLSNLVASHMNLIQDPDFRLHVVIENLKQEYPKLFLNELIKYLKPSLLIVTYKMITDSLLLSNYISTIPMMVIKRKAARKRSIA